MADEEPLTSASVPKDGDSDRFYMKGVAFAYSSVGAASSVEDDDYDDESPVATSSVATTADQSVTSTDLSVVDAFSSQPTHQLDTATSKQEAVLGSNLLESQDSGTFSQTPPLSLEDSQFPSFPVPSEPGPRDQQPAAQSEEAFTDLPDNMSLDQLHAKVKKLFPGFKPNSILRFSSLLGPGKPSSLPNLWREAKKPQKKRKVKSDEPVELKLDCNFIPPDYMINTDDEVAPAFLV